MQSFLEQKSLKNKTKIQVYWAVVYTTLLCGLDTWVTFHSHIRFFERFNQCCLCTILNILLFDFVTNVEILEQAEIPSIEAMLFKYQLRWAGHVSRLKDHRLSKIALYGELSTGHRESGAPKKRYEDCPKKSLTACHVDPQWWSDMATDCDAWRHLIFIVLNVFEQDGRNAQIASHTTPDVTFTCRHWS